LRPLIFPLICIFGIAEYAVKKCKKQEDVSGQLKVRSGKLKNVLFVEAIIKNANTATEQIGFM